ncbi:MAG TPA: NlpC/P60 family protein [Coriobacteriia bacterium]|nr:NlpC/P60 family protein [Coriobacteriia bacterium]
MRGTTSPHIVRRLGAAVLCAVLVMGAAAPVFATSPAEKIRATQAKAREAQGRMDALSTDLEERSEEYLAAREELEATRARIRVNTGELEVAEREVSAAQALLNTRASSIYRDGPVSLVSVLVGATDFRDLVTRLDLMQRVGRSDATLVARVEKARNRVERTRRSLETRRSEQVVLLKRTQQERAEVESALDAQKSYLAGIDRDLNKLIAEERARQERLARERAEAKARAAKVAAAAERQSSDTTSKNSSAVSGPSGGSTLPAAHGSVVEIARSFVGKTPYVWGGTTPQGFDCSGLTMYCYRQKGVSLPRTSRQQFNAGQRIAADRLDLLRAGDLVFFGTDGDTSRIHHVGIYSGNGMYIHAPQTGMMVSESSLTARIETRGDYVGAVRP